MLHEAAPGRRKVNSSLFHGKYSIRNLVDIDRLRHIFEKFSRVTGFGTAFVEYPSQEVLIARAGERSAPSSTGPSPPPGKVAGKATPT
jgi:hypothetical protein